MKNLTWDNIQENDQLVEMNQEEHDDVSGAGCRYVWVCRGGKWYRKRVCTPNVCRTPPIRWW